MDSCNPLKPPHCVGPTMGAPLSTIIHTHHPHQHSRLMIKGNQNSRPKIKMWLVEKMGGGPWATAQLYPNGP